MAAATGLTVVAPHLLTRGRARERAARAAVRPPASVLAAQVTLEGALGVLSDASHPVSGAVFSLYRLGQIRRARAAVARGTPRVRRVLAVQTWFWRANLVLLLLTTVGRTVMRPRGLAGAGVRR